MQNYTFFLEKIYNSERQRKTECEKYKKSCSDSESKRVRERRREITEIV